MRIGLVIYGSLDTLSGGYLYDRQLVDCLVRAGDRVELLSIPWRNYPRHLMDNFSSELYKRLVTQDVDVLLQDELNHPSLAVINRRLRGRVSYPIVSIVHHLRCSEDHAPALNHLYRQTEKLYVNSVDGFICNSFTTLESVQPLLEAEKPGFVAYPAADHLPVPTPSEAAELIAVRFQKPDPLRVIFIGNIIPRKGLDRLLGALGRLDRGGWVLDVVGSLQIDTAYVRRIRRQCTRLGLAANVTWHGRLDQSELVALLRGSHLLAVPSYEGFGIVYLEAMAFGLPVIASTAGAAHEIVRDGQEGYLIDPGNTETLANRLQSLANDRAVLHSMAQAARARFNRHPGWVKSMATAQKWLHEVF